MLPLLETVIGFAVIMMLLSLLVKSLTSVLKNHIDYYSKNLEMEVKRLISGTFEGGIASLGDKVKWIKNIEWRRLREDYLSEENMKWLLKKLGADEDSLEDLKGRVEVHKSNLRYAFEKRTKNISLMLGLAFCLALNINAFSIWSALYNDQQLRTKFSSQEATKFALQKAEENLGDKKISESETEDLKKQREEFREEFYRLRHDISFGMGRIWKEPVEGFADFFYEFFGTLLTGILVSIGAPYWHDLLRSISALRKPKPAKTEA